ncbi:hypothetical protein HDU96_004198 [Phlyctochytrium bullatum]|nr:hypothetical protein HDU96_004198 [Phlyctochytrium bullatum]
MSSRIPTPTGAGAAPPSQIPTPVSATRRTASPVTARRSLTPQPSSHPERMYRAPTVLRTDDERGRTMSRAGGHRQHPVWDAVDRDEATRRLYGPLITTVRELAEAAAASAASAGPSSGGSATPVAESSSARSSSVTLAGSTSSLDVAATPASVMKAAQSSSRHTSRAIVHALTSAYPKTRYRVGWDARATAALRWALPDRVLDWGFNALAAAARAEKEEERRREEAAAAGGLVVANPV